MQRLRRLYRNSNWIEMFHLGILGAIFAIGAGVCIARAMWDAPFIWTPLLFFAGMTSPVVFLDTGASRRVRLALAFGVIGFCLAALIAILIAAIIKSEWLAMLALSAIVWFVIGEWFWLRSDARSPVPIPRKSGWPPA